MIILDIDNCISDDSARVKLIDWSKSDTFDRYDAYHRASMDDPAHVEGFQGRDDVIIITSRPQSYCGLTRKWLARHGVTYELLLMRNMRNRLPSASFKICALAELIGSKDFSIEDIEVAYDDREDVLQAYRQIGLHAVQKKIHDIDTMIKGD